MSAPGDVRSRDAREIVDHLPAADALAGATVLVTGATGFIGQHVVAALLELSDRHSRPIALSVLVRDETRAVELFHDAMEAGRLNIVVGDVADPAALAGVRADYVIHAASPATPSAFRADPVGVVRANVQGTWNVLDLARRSDGYVCLVSTVEIYGEAVRARPDEDVVFTESDVGRLDSMEPRSSYPESKRVAENLCVAYANQYGVRSDVVRLSHTYGGGAADADDRVQAQFFRQAIDGSPITLASDGSLTRTYTYVADAVSALLTVLLTAGTRTEVEAFNVASEADRISIRGLAELTLAAAGRPATDLTIGAPPAGNGLWSRTSGSTYVDCAKIRNLGWAARYPLADGLARTIETERARRGAAAAREA